MNINQDIYFEEYKDQHDNQIIELEQESAMSLGPNIPLNLFKVQTIFHKNYSSRPKQFEIYKIFVARDKKTQKIIGVVNGVVKDVILFEKSYRIAQIFGLKVHNKYCRKGIATKLLEILNESLKKIEVSYVYAKIEANNLNAWDLFANKLQYTDAFYQDSWIIHPVKSVKLTQLSVEKAFELTQKFYDKRDLSTKEMWPIFKSTHYIGTYIVDTERGYAGISLWDSSAYSDLKIVKAIVNTESLKSNYLIYSIIWLLLFSFLFIGLYVGYDCYFKISEPVLQQIYFIVGLVIIWKYISCLLEIKTHAQIAINQKNTKIGKTFGFFYECTEENRRNILTELAEGLSTEAFEHGLEYISLEMKLDKTYMKDLEMYQLGITKNYVQKSLFETEIYPWMPFPFIDPRD